MNNVLAGFSFRMVFDSSVDALLITDVAGQILLANPAAQQLLDYSESSILGLVVEDLMPARYRTKHLSYRDVFSIKPEKRVMGGSIELYALRRDGHELAVEVSLTPLSMEGYEFTLINMQDITMRKLAEAKLKQSEDLSRLIMNSIGSSIAVISQTGEIINVNQAWRDFAEANGGSAATIKGIGMNYFETLSQDSSDEIASAVRASMQAVLNGSIPKFSIEYPCNSPNEKRWFMLNVTSTGSVRGELVVIHIDITKRKLAEAALDISNERLRLSKLAAGLGIFDRNLISGELYFDEQALNLLGYDPEEVLNYERFLTSVYPEDRLAIKVALELASDPAGNGEYYQEVRIIRSIDGIERWLSAKGQIYFEAGHAVRHVGTIQDITERIQAADTLKKSRDQLKIFVNHAPLSIAMFDQDMNYISYSELWLKQYNRGYANLIGHNLYEVHPDLPVEWKVVHQKVLDGATLENSEDGWIQSDGSTHWLRWTALPWLDANFEIGGIIIATEDITDKKILEMEVIRQRNDFEYLQKKHIASQTVSAIAHEINQPLAAISSYSEIALRALDSNNIKLETLSHALKGCVEQSQRAGKTLHELLNFLHAGKSKSEPFDLNDTILNALTLVQSDNLIGFHQILELEHGLPLLLGDRTQIKKVLVNLIRNGAEAMHEAGLSAGTINIKVKILAEKNMALIMVKDSGAGLDVETAKKVFDPFFTTKPNGIGLGLAISRSMVEDNNGQIWLEQNPEQGSTFHFTLPFAV